MYIVHVANVCKYIAFWGQSPEIQHVSNISTRKKNYSPYVHTCKCMTVHPPTLECPSGGAWYWEPGRAWWCTPWHPSARRASSVVTCIGGLSRLSWHTPAWTQPPTGDSRHLVQVHGRERLVGKGSSDTVNGNGRQPSTTMRISVGTCTNLTFVRASVRPCVRIMLKIMPA